MDVADPAAVQAKVVELGARISADFDGRELTLVSVLKGSLPFMADLMRAVTIPVTIDLMEVSSYGGTATESSGLVRIIKDLSASIAGEESTATILAEHGHRVLVLEQGLLAEILTPEELRAKWLPSNQATSCSRLNNSSSPWLQPSRAR